MAAQVDLLEWLRAPTEARFATWRCSYTSRGASPPRRGSSTTREYLGAIIEVAALRERRGEFDTEEAFYKYWRAYPIRVPKAVERQAHRP